MHGRTVPGHAEPLEIGFDPTVFAVDRGSGETRPLVVVLSARRIRACAAVNVVVVMARPPEGGVGCSQTRVR
jgi:hypothetical protein